MTFHIISVGWQCAGWLEQTLASIEEQKRTDWQAWITYDPSDDDGAKRLVAWREERWRDGRWHVQLNTERKFAVRNQWEAITAADPDADDIIVFLDLDGDQLAHPRVLERLAGHYADGALLTYGSYRPVPDPRTCAPALPFPDEVVRTNSYRRHILSGAGCCFNHLRTMSGRVFKAIPPEHFRWARGPKRGQFYEAGTDYIFMVAGLELAGGHYLCVPEVLCLYNAANENADYLYHPAEANACTQDYLRRRPLKPLGELPVPEPEIENLSSTVEQVRTQPIVAKDPFLPPEQRRRILRDYGKKFELRMFVETGTANGDTPWALRKDFSRLWTIEVGEAQYKAAVHRFAGTNVTCLHGDSAKHLPRVLEELGGTPALFWLDGHACGGDRAEKDTPILEELEAIFATGTRHVILVDDARLFKGMPHYGEWDWPPIQDVRDRAEAAGYTFEVRDDIIRLVPC